MSGQSAILKPTIQSKLNTWGNFKKWADMQLASQLSSFKGGNEMKELRPFQINNSHLDAILSSAVIKPGWTPNIWVVEEKGNLKGVLPQSLFFPGPQFWTLDLVTLSKKSKSC